MNETDKIQVKTQIEKRIHKMVSHDVKEHVRDFVVLYLRRQKFPIENNQLQTVLNVVQTAIDDGYEKFVDNAVSDLLNEAEKYSVVLQKDVVKPKKSDEKSPKD